MVTVLGFPLIGTLFLPTLLGVITFYIIWSISTRRKDESCAGGLISAARGPSDPVLAVNSVGSKPEKKDLGNRAISSPNHQSDDNSCAEGDVHRAAQQKVQYASNSRRKVFRSKAADQGSQTLQAVSDLTKRNTRKKHCKGKPGCCSKKNGASDVLEGTIETVKVFFGTQTGKAKVKCNTAVGSSHICFSFFCLTLLKRSGSYVPMYPYSYIAICSVHFNIKKNCILPTKCIYVFCMILITNGDYFPNNINQLIDLFETRCSL
jgi:hypothetical protein